MNRLTQPGAAQQPADVLVQIGIGDDGGPLYAYRATVPTTAPAAPLVHHPYAAYAGAGCLALAALIVVAFVIVAVVIGLAIALIVLAISVVALTICLLILRGLWADYRHDRAKRR